jgi:two-component system, NtrC family, C4-dicarboxylate transport response regulator DctD
MNKAARELVMFVDDDDAVRAANAQTLRLVGLEAVTYAHPEAALAALDAHFPGCVITDLRMPRMDGLELQRRIGALDREIPVILITGHGDVEDAVVALQAGAYDFITKPFAPDRLLASVRRALNFRSLVLDNRRLVAAMEGAEPDVPLLGDAPAVVALREMIRRLADTDANVLIEGEPGVGKEHVARILHGLSRRRTRTFSVVECGLITDVQIAEDLFGEAQKSPGLRPRLGKIELADNGALFLHDVDSATPALQTALARVIEERAFTPTRGGELRSVSFRAIAAAGCDLAQAAAAGRFRRDLFYGLAMARLTIPPLRERRGDIMALFATFVQDAARRQQRPVPLLTDAVRRRLIDHEWPGNLRELQHFAERVVLGLDAATAAPQEAAEPSLPDRVNAFEAGVIKDALRVAGGDVRAALQALKIPRKTFYDKINRHGIDLDAFRSGKAES